MAVKFNPGKTVRNQATRNRGGQFDDIYINEPDSNLERAVDLLDDTVKVDFEPSQREWLEQVGNTPIYLSPNESVSPFDCKKYPTSPFCGQKPPFDPLDATEFLLENEISVNPCEACIELQPKFFGLQMPPYMICYRPQDETGVCNKPIDDEPVESVPIEGEESNPKIAPIAPPSKQRIVFSTSLVIRYEYEPIYHESGNGFITGERLINSTAITHSGQCFVKIPPINEDDFQWNKHPFTRSYYDPWGYLYNPDASTHTGQRTEINNLFTKYGEFYWQRFTYKESHRIPNSINFNTDKLVYTYVFFYDAECSQSIQSVELLAKLTWVSAMTEYSEYYTTPEYITEDTGYYKDALFVPSYNDIALYGYAKSCPPKKRPLPSQPLPPNKPMDCCEESLELLELIAKRLGANDYPISVPALLTQDDKDESTIKLESQAEYNAYLVTNLDAVTGQYPIEIEIEDTDPTKEGKQKAKISIPNQAEGIAELFGLTYKAETTIDLLIEVVFKLIPEVLAIKNATILAQTYAKANASYLGYRGNLSSEKVPCNFNVDTAESIEDFLRGKAYEVPIWRDESKEDLQSTLQHLLFAASIIKATNYVGGGDVESLLQTISNMATDEALSVANKQDWKEWIKTLNKDDSRQNKEQFVQPAIIEENPLEDSDGN